jgi:hypothetical protein
LYRSGGFYEAVGVVSKKVWGILAARIMAAAWKVVRPSEIGAEDKSLILAAKLFKWRQGAWPLNAPIRKLAGAHRMRFIAANLLHTLNILLPVPILICPQDINNLLRAMIKYAVGLIPSRLKTQIV